MHPILFHIGDMAIRSYGLMAALGFLAASLLVNVNRRYAKMSTDQASTLVLIGMIAGIIGARLFYVIQFYDQEFQGHFLRVFRVDQGGLVFYGGFILAIIALIVYCRMQKLDVVRVLDVCCPGIALAHAFGRIGCFLNGCCFGKAAEHFWCITYPEGSAPFQKYGAVPLHPVQLYEAGEMTLLFLLMFYLVRHCRRGVAMSSYLLIYGILRFCNELVRGDNPHVFNLFTPAQLIGFLLIPAGLGLLVYFLKHESKNSQLQH